MIGLALIGGRERDEERLAERRSDELQPHGQPVGPEAARKEDRGDAGEIAGGDEADVPGAPVRGRRRARRRRRVVERLRDRRRGDRTSDREDHVNIAEHRVERVHQARSHAHGM